MATSDTQADPVDGGSFTTLGDTGPLEDLGELEPTTPALIGDDGRVRLSFSRIDTYRTCPAQFRYRYLERLPGVPSPHLSFGTSIHAALERFYDRKLPGVPAVDDLLEGLYDLWDPSGFAELTRDEQIAWYRHAQDVLRRYHRRVAASYRLPADVERWFELPVGDHALVVGSIDRVDVDDEGSLHVIDYKTNRKVRDRDAVRRSLQLGLYALACEHLYGALPASVCLDFVVPGVEVRVPLDELDLDAARTAADGTALAVLAERFEATPNRLCDWCDFRALCPAWEGEDDGTEILGAAVSELEQLRRRLRRDVRTMRELEETVGRLQQELADRSSPAADRAS